MRIFWPGTSTVEFTEQFGLLACRAGRRLLAVQRVRGLSLPAPTGGAKRGGFEYQRPRLQVESIDPLLGASEEEDSGGEPEVLFLK